MARYKIKTTEERNILIEELTHLLGVIRGMKNRYIKIECEEV